MMVLRTTILLLIISTHLADPLYQEPQALQDTLAKLQLAEKQHLEKIVNACLAQTNCYDCHAFEEDNSTCNWISNSCHYNEQRIYVIPWFAKFEMCKEQDINGNFAVCGDVKEENNKISIEPRLQNHVRYGQNNFYCSYTVSLKEKIDNYDFIGITGFINVHH